MSKSKPTGWFGRLTSYSDPDFSRYMRRAFLASAGWDREDCERPIIGIADTSSDYNTCHRDMPAMIEAVKRGVLQAGGVPVVFPTCSLNEIFMSPTTMLYRNLLAMETEELIRSQPMDGVVLMGGCDKTVPAQLMAAASANLPAIQLVTGAMRSGSWRGERLGACTDCRRMWARHRAGELTEAEITEIEQSLCSTGGTCMVMGSASTMACVTEAMGLMVSGGASALSGSGKRLRLSVATGRRIVGIVRDGLKPLSMMTRPSFENALTVLLALGGSTNAIIHLIAIARRAGVNLSLGDFDRLSRQVPLLVDCKPAGVGYMEDFDRAGGMPVLLGVLRPLLHLDVPTVMGQTLGQLLENQEAPGDWQQTIRPLDAALGASESLVVLEGNLAPDGAVLKKSAATPALFTHRGPAVVFESPEDAANRIDDPSLGITPSHVMVLRNAGPAASGMPEAGSLPIPKYLAAQGVTDMVRLSDGRMSGTAYGTIVLHCAPEAARGGTLAVVHDGDEISLDVDQRRIDLLVPDAEIEARRAALPEPPRPSRGWRLLHAQHVLQANDGADLDFLI